MKAKLIKIIKRFDEIVFMILSFTTITNKLYYFFLSRKFDREIISVSQGRKTFLQNRFNKNVLVRNIHRIEKGISMKERRNIFAKDYIDETIDSFIECNEKFINDEQIDWAYQVLEKYFDLVDLKVLEKQYSKFKSIQYKSRKKTIKVPFMRKDSKVSSITYEEFFKLNLRRRSVRWYKDQFISEILIVKALEVAKLSPSACNRQPFKFLFFNKKSDVGEISSIPMGTSGYSYNIPSIVVVVGDLSSYFSERDRHVIYIDASLAAMTFMLTLETMGLSSCPINWPDIEKLERKMKKKLSLKSYERPVMLISVGYADERGIIPYSCKKNENNLIKK